MAHHSCRPGVSVAMCTYNGSIFLQQQLDSIAAQTVLPDELIVQDDRSSDGSIELLAAFAQRMTFPVHVQVNSHQLGPARNFAACIARCSGDIVILTDQDDMWFEDRVARTLAAHRDEGVMFTFSDAPLIGADTQPLGRTIFGTVPISKGDREILDTGHNLLPLILRYGVIYGTTMSIRRDLADVAPLPDKWSHDEWFSLIGAATGTSRRLEPVTQYRQHDAQVVGAGQAGAAALMSAARQRSAEFYAGEQARYDAALTAITGRPGLYPLASLVSEKTAFIAARRRIQSSLLAAGPLVLQQWLKGNYCRFAGGMRSVLKDILASASSLGTRG